MRGCSPGRLAPAARSRPGRSRPRCCARASGCGQCPSCRQVAAGTHPDLLLVRPDGLSYGVKQTRDLVLKAAASPVYGGWRIVLFEDADRATEQAANALLKAIEEPPPRTIWLLCAPSAADLPTTIRSRCRLVTLRTPPTDAVAAILRARGRDRDVALEAARASLGHIGRARRLATDTETARRRAEVLTVPLRVTSVGEAFAAAAALVKAAEAEATATTEELDGPSATRSSARSARARPARASPPPSGERRARSRNSRTGRSPGRPGSSETRSTWRCWIWPRSTGTCSPFRSAPTWNWRTPAASATCAAVAEASGPGHDRPADRGDHDLPGAAGRERRPAAGSRRTGAYPRRAPFGASLTFLVLWLVHPLRFLVMDGPFITSPGG